MRNKYNERKNVKKAGFTLIEVLVVIGIIAILASVVLVAINPGRQFAQARNTQRISNVNAILTAIGQNMADNKGLFTCASALPASATKIGTATGEYDILPCIVPKYVSEIPFDPSSGKFTSTSDYATGYTVLQDATTLRVTVGAPSAELTETISVTR